MPYKLFNAASAVFNDRLYIIGGIDDTNTVTKNVLEYEPLTDRWGISIKQKSEFTIALKLKSILCYLICSQLGQFQAYYLVHILSVTLQQHS